jgi:uncharacterized protein (UPF0335 family)
LTSFRQQWEPAGTHVDIMQRVIQCKQCDSAIKHEADACPSLDLYATVCGKGDQELVRKNN